MISLHTLAPAEGSRKTRKRIGRGQGSGRGGTSTKGHKGDKARSGYWFRPGFEGGQMPMHRRKPKFGFKNHFRKEYKIFTLDQLQWYSSKFNVQMIDSELLLANNVIKSTKTLLKVINKGTLNAKVSVKVHKVTKGAQAIIEGLGGTIELIPEKTSKSE